MKKTLADKKWEEALERKKKIEENLKVPERLLKFSDEQTLAHYQFGITAKERASLRTVKFTLAEILKRFKKTHGDKYVYDKVLYKGIETKVEITCKKHGSFFQTPSAHINKQGCPFCTKFWHKDDLILKFKAVHGNTYNYDKVIFKNSATRIEIICKIHGSFHQLPIDHANGNGCSYCSVKWSQSDLLKEFRKKHGDTFIYDKVSYVNTTTKIEIICRKHGSFFTTPTLHLRNKGGCESCRIESRRNTINSFIEKASRVHKNKYDYSKSIYETGKSIIKIGCPKHGDFDQKAIDHLSGRGCQKCATEIHKKNTPEQINERKKATIKKFVEIHGKKYDYSNINYVNVNTKINILCRKHGIFMITPAAHLSKKVGCPNCRPTAILDEKIIEYFNKMNSIISTAQIVTKIYGKIKENKERKNKGDIITSRLTILIKDGKIGKIGKGLFKLV